MGQKKKFNLCVSISIRSICVVYEVVPIPDIVPNLHREVMCLFVCIDTF